MKGIDLSTKTIDHLGLVSGMYDELGIGNLIDSKINQDQDQREVSIGTLVKALVINGLGFAQRTLYMVESFFENKATSQLLGDEVESSHLNDTVLGRALDSIHAYGTTELFSQLSPQVCSRLGLQPRSGHLDSTSFHLDGDYNSENPPGENENVIHLTQGYSRDYHPELNQAVLSLITENQAGIPLHMEALSGNKDDKTSFRETIANHVEQLQNATGLEYLIMDSAGYTKETISEHSDSLKWISRVPQNIKECKALVREKISDFQPLTKGYGYKPLISTYADVKQRWLLVFSEKGYEREVKTLKKNFQQKGLEEYKSFQKLCRHKFTCEQDALNALASFQKTCKYLSVNELPIESKPVFKGKGRPKKEEKPSSYNFFTRGLAYCKIEDYETLREEKGKFIIATNELDSENLLDKEVFQEYKDQSKVERGFRFLKDPQFVASSFFVKKPERVEALLFIMTLCLTVYAALEYKIRKRLREEGKTLPNQLGKQINNPTTRWIFTLFTGTHCLYGFQKVRILNINELQIKIIDLLGDNYKKYYLLE